MSRLLRNIGYQEEQDMKRPIVAGLLTAFITLAVACTASPPSAPVQADRGRQLYSQSCAVCHGDAATGRGAIPTAGSHGPQGHTWHHADGQLAGIILGRLDYPNRTMPSFAGQLSDQDVADILGYLKTNWTPQQRASQAEASKGWEARQRGQ